MHPSFIPKVHYRMHPSLSAFPNAQVCLATTIQQHIQQPCKIEMLLTASSLSAEQVQMIWPADRQRASVLPDALLRCGTADALLP
jgi:hypothetical protein